MKKRGVLSWVIEFAGRKKSYFGGSVTLAILGVAASFVPYLITADIVGQLLKGNKDPQYYLYRFLMMAGFCCKPSRRLTSCPPLKKSMVGKPFTPRRSLSSWLAS